MNEKPLLRITETEINDLIEAIEVSFVALSHCTISKGYALELGGVGVPGLHYNLKGKGQVITKGHSPIPIEPHTLIIVPPYTPIRIEVEDDKPARTLRVVDGSTQNVANGIMRRFVAGDGSEDTTMVCGFFNATYGISLNPFSTLHIPIVEQFGTEAQLDRKLESAVEELVAMEVGARAMSSVLLKEILIHILRRSLHSNNLWVEHFAVFTNTQIARAFSKMVSEPAGLHSVNALADIACLSRSAFMAQFTDLFRESPMSVLRKIRMRHAARLLRIKGFSIEEIAHHSGYKNKTNFNRAFQKVYDMDPTSYRERKRESRDVPIP